LATDEQLPAITGEQFGDDDLDFRLYKVLAAHGAGQVEFGTYDHGGSLAAARAISDAYDQKTSTHSTRLHSAMRWSILLTRKLRNCLAGKTIGYRKFSDYFRC
jgi:hypothetical protein